MDSSPKRKYDVVSDNEVVLLELGSNKLRKKVKVSTIEETPSKEQEQASKPGTSSTPHRETEGYSGQIYSPHNNTRNDAGRKDVYLCTIRHLEATVASLQERLKDEQDKEDSRQEELTSLHSEKCDLRTKCRKLEEILDRAEELYDDLRDRMIQDQITNKDEITTVYSKVLDSWNEQINKRPTRIDKSPSWDQEEWN